MIFASYCILVGWLVGWLRDLGFTIGSHLLIFFATYGGAERGGEAGVVSLGQKLGILEANGGFLPRFGLALEFTICSFILLRTKQEWYRIIENYRQGKVLY